MPSSRPEAPLILCSMHGALFEMESGLCVSGPCEGLGLRALPVRVERGYVMLEDERAARGAGRPRLGEPASRGARRDRPGVGSASSASGRSISE